MTLSQRIVRISPTIWKVERGRAGMVSRTSGGLVKFSLSIPEPLLREVERIAATEPGRRRNGVIVNMISRGIQDYRREQEILRQHKEQADEANRGAA